MQRTRDRTNNLRSLIRFDPLFVTLVSVGKEALAADDFHFIPDPARSSASGGGGSIGLRFSMIAALLTIRRRWQRLARGLSSQ